MNRKAFIMSLALSTLLGHALALADAPAKGRIVVFADKKVGSFKTDKSIRAGTVEKLDMLKSIGTDLGVHACFIGSSDSVKSILGDMIANSNKTEKAPFSLKKFSAATEAGQQSISVEVTSDSSKQSYLQLKLDPC